MARFLCVLVCLVIASPVAAMAQEESQASPQEGGNAKSPSEMKRIVKRHLQALAEGSGTEQAEAEQALIDLGPAVLDVLADLDVADPTAKQAVGRVRDKLLRGEAESAAKATSVTLKGEMKLSAAIKAIAEQTGNKIIDYRPNFGQEETDPKLKLDLKGQPFWAALDEVLKQADLTMYGYPEEKGVALVARDADAKRVTLPLCDRGPFRVEAFNLSAIRDLRNPAADQLQVQVQVYWEPRLSPISLDLPLVTLEAKDEKGDALEINGLGVRTAEISGAGFATELALPFKLPARGVEKIASLKGKMTVLVPGRADTYRFGDLDKLKEPAVQERAGATVVLQSIQKNNDAWEIRVVVKFDKSSGALQSHRGWIFRNVTYLETADKAQVEFELRETFRQTENEVGLAYYYPLSVDLEGATLVYKTPSIIMSLPVEFELKDLKLP